MLGHFRTKPGIWTEPGRMDKMVERHDGFQPILTAGHQHINVVIQRFVIERRGCAHPIDIGGLHPAPLYPQAESVETKLPATREILRIAVPKVGTKADRGDIFSSLCGCPVGLRLARPVIAPLGLIGRSRYSPQKLTHWLPRFIISLLAGGYR